MVDKKEKSEYSKPCLTVHDTVVKLTKALSTIEDEDGMGGKLTG